MDKEYWIFTFGCGQEHAGFYVKIYGSYGEARQKMFAKYGSAWSFQHSASEWQNWLDTKPAFIPEEEELEVIE